MLIEWRLKILISSKGCQSLLSSIIRSCILLIQYYRIAGNFHGVQFLWMVNLYFFTDLIFADVRTQSQYCIAGNFRGVVFTDDRLTVKIKPAKKSSIVQYIMGMSARVHEI